jgi:hypothetical protein
VRLVEDARLLLAQERTLVVLPPEIIGPQRDIPNHNSCPLIAAAPHDTVTAHKAIGYKQSAQRLAEQGGAAERSDQARRQVPQHGGVLYGTGTP